MTARAFDRQESGTRVVFGRGRRHLLASLLPAWSSVLLVATAGRQQQWQAVLGPSPWAKLVPFTDVPQHVPREALQAASALVERESLDAAVAFGGGSPIGVVKALAVESRLRTVFVPTTFSGSEVTDIWAVSDETGKTTGRDPRARPEVVIYDPDLVDEMPAAVVFPSLYNAMAHAVEALYAPGVSAEVVDGAQSAVVVLAGAIEALIVDSHDADAREEALYGAYLAGKSLDRAQMGLHHKLAHVIGGAQRLPHGPLHSVLLPYSLSYNERFIPSAMEVLRGPYGERPIAGLVEQQRRAGVATSLDALGLAEESLSSLVTPLSDRPYPNPRPLEREALQDLLRAAFVGELAR